MRFIDYLLAFLLVIGVGGTLYLITSTSPTVRETTFLSALLAILSILSAWLVTHTYARLERNREITRVQEMHQANLRTYALKAAEKVNNLSNELSRLAVYLGEELEDDEYPTPQAVLQGREEKLASAIHLVNTLKSMNDMALSDWEGVIGAELDEQREAREQQIEELEGLARRLQMLYEPLRDGVVSSQESSEELRGEIAAVRRDLRTALVLSSVPIRTAKKLRRTKVDVTNVCPSCGSLLNYQQKPSPLSIKPLSCEACRTKLISRYSTSDGFVLKVRTQTPIEFECPNCGKKCSKLLDNFPGSTIDTTCDECHAELRVSRTIDAFRVTVLGLPKGKKLPENLLEKVAKSLPKQPWPKGVHRLVADELGISVTLVSKAVTELIRVGRFRPQFDGKILVPADETPMSSAESPLAGDQAEEPSPK